MTHKCQCQQTGKLNPAMASWYHEELERPFVDHEPGACRCTNNVRLFQHGRQKLWLCSCCWGGDDKLIIPLTSEDNDG